MLTRLDAIVSRERTSLTLDLVFAVAVLLAMLAAAYGMATWST